MFVKKSIAEFEAMTAEEQKNYLAAKEVHEAEQAAQKMKEVADKAVEGLATSEELKKLNDTVKQVSEAVTAMKENGKGAGVEKTLADQIKEKKQDILTLVKGGNKSIEFKTLVSRPSVANSPAGFVIPDIGQLGVKQRSLYNVLPRITISDANTHGLVRYRDWDEATINRAATMVAESAAFPESTAAWAWYSIPLRKVGDSIPVTEEFFEDEAQAASEINMFLDVNVNTQIDSQLITGDNTGENLNGILNTSPVYTPVASGIPQANLKDLTIKMRNAITRDRGSKYSPDMLLVSSSTMEDLILAKDANNNYIFDENTGTLGGLSVVVDENMPDNQIIVGDRRYVRIYERTGVVMSRGRVNNQFLEDEVSLKVRKRMLILMREVDKTGFLKVADVTAALTILATNP